MPYMKRERYVNELNLSTEDAIVLTEDKGIADFFEKTAELSNNPKSSSNWILSTLLGYMKENQTLLDDLKITPENLAEMISLIDDGDISGKIAKDVFDEMYKTGKSAKEIVDEKGLKQISDSGELEKMCKEVLDKYPEIVEDIRNGKDRAKGRLVGEVMKNTQGQANPKMVSDILDKYIYL
jgi:aspartyl-tRNA(Asn)/glutamyl-tRNA(Gln) amidotransferase subunit B